MGSEGLDWCNLLLDRCVFVGFLFYCVVGDLCYYFVKWRFLLGYCLGVGCFVIIRDEIGFNVDCLLYLWF